MDFNVWMASQKCIYIFSTDAYAHVRESIFDTHRENNWLTLAALFTSWIKISVCNSAIQKKGLEVKFLINVQIISRRHWELWIAHIARLCEKAICDSIWGSDHKKDVKILLCFWTSMDPVRIHSFLPTTRNSPRFLQVTSKQVKCFVILCFCAKVFIKDRSVISTDSSTKMPQVSRNIPAAS